MFFLMILLFLIVASLLTIIAVQNLAVSVHLSFFSWQTPNLPVGLWLIGAVILGALLLYTVSIISAVRERRDARNLRKLVAELEQQLAHYTAQPAPMSMPTPPMNMPTPMPAPMNMPTPPMNMAAPMNMPHAVQPVPPSTPMMSIPGISTTSHSGGLLKSRGGGELQSQNFR